MASGWASALRVVIPIPRCDSVVALGRFAVTERGKPCAVTKQGEQCGRHGGLTPSRSPTSTILAKSSSSLQPQQLDIFVPDIAAVIL